MTDRRLRVWLVERSLLNEYQFVTMSIHITRDAAVAEMELSEMMERADDEDTVRQCMKNAEDFEPSTYSDSQWRVRQMEVLG